MEPKPREVAADAAERAPEVRRQVVRIVQDDGGNVEFLRRTFCTLTGSVMETASPQWSSTSSRNTMRLVHGSAAKSHAPRLNTISRAPDFFATPVRGQIKSTCPMLRLFKSPYSGTPFNSAFTRRNSRFAFTCFDIALISFQFNA